MEDKVYTINWSRTDAGWTLWAKEQPEWRITDADRDNAKKALALKMIKSGGAMHPVFEFEPALPVEEWERELGVPELYLIGGGNNRFDTPKSEGYSFDSKTWSAKMTPQYERFLQTFSESPICRTCRNTRGPRTQKPLQVAAISPHCDSAFGSPQSGLQHNCYIFSESFLDLLTKEERERLIFLEVVLLREKDKSQNSFFELMGPPGPKPVAVQGFDLGGWHCPVCGYQCFFCSSKGGQLEYFYAANELPSPLPGLFTVASRDGGVELCATGIRWRQLKDQIGTREFLSTRVGVVPEPRVLREFTLPTQEEARQEGKRRRQLAKERRAKKQELNEGGNV